MHSATYLSTASIAIIAYADHNPWSQAYGVMLLPIALGFIVYAMVNCKWDRLLFGVHLASVFLHFHLM